MLRQPGAYERPAFSRATSWELPRRVDGERRCRRRVGRGAQALGLAALLALPIVAAPGSLSGQSQADGAPQAQEELAHGGATVGGPTAATTIFALGDGANGSAASRALAAFVVAQKPDRFFYLGDVYEAGTRREFEDHYDDVYGPLAERTDPVLGNHEFANRRSGYYPYWRRERGWSSERAKHRSYVLPQGWQIIAYSSEHPARGEARWVGRQIDQYRGTCRIAIAHRGHHVLADSAHGDERRQERIWAELRNKTVLQLVAHVHVAGRLRRKNGVHVIVSGGGGAQLRRLAREQPRDHAVAEVVSKRGGKHTATKLTLRRGVASYQQVDEDGTVHDSRRFICTPVQRSSRRG